MTEFLPKDDPSLGVLTKLHHIRWVFRLGCGEGEITWFTLFLYPWNYSPTSVWRNVCLCFCTYSFRYLTRIFSSLNSFYVMTPSLIDRLIDVTEELMSVCVTVRLSAWFQMTDHKEDKASVRQQLEWILYNKHSYWHEHHHLLDSLNLTQPEILL